jgi:hypothetical protein
MEKQIKSSSTLLQLIKVVINSFKKDENHDKHLDTEYNSPITFFKQVWNRKEHFHIFKKHNFLICLYFLIRNYNLNF